MSSFGFPHKLHPLDRERALHTRHGSCMCMITESVYTIHVLACTVSHTVDVYVHVQVHNNNIMCKSCAYVLAVQLNGQRRLLLHKHPLQFPAKKKKKKISEKSPW